MSSAVDWLTLPAELLEIIVGDLHTIIDYISFSSVCRYWRDAVKLRLGFVPQQFPSLMLPLNQSYNRGCFINPLTNSHYGRGRPSLPEASSNPRCIGSSLSRVILIDDSPDMVVLNPITGEKTYLPPLSSLPLPTEYTAMKNEYRYGRRYSLEEMRDNLLRKVILTPPPPNSPHPNNFSALAISYRGFNHLSYCKHGDPSWRRIDGTSEDYEGVEDAIYYRGKLYLVNPRRALSVCDFNDHDNTPVMNSITRDDGLAVGGNRKYIVDVKGELLLVERYIKYMRRGGFLTARFCVLKFDWSAREWKAVTSLGDSVVFVGHNSSFAITAGEYSGCKGNRIYFTDDYYRHDYDYYKEKNNEYVKKNDQYKKHYDVGVYDLTESRIGRIRLYDRGIPLYDRKESLPVWFTPSLW